MLINAVLINVAVEGIKVPDAEVSEKNKNKNKAKKIKNVGSNGLTDFSLFEFSALAAL